MIYDNPKLIWEGFKEPYVTAWEQGNPGAAFGRGTFELATMLLGTKGLDKAEKGAEAAEAAADVAKTADKISDAAKIAEKADEALKLL